MVTAAAFITAARSLIGVPYVHQGHTEHGVDCMGLPYVAALKVGIDLKAHCRAILGESTPSFNYRAQSGPTALTLMENCFVPALRPVPGCLILIRFPKQPHPQHFAVCTGETIIHALRTHKAVFEVGYRAQWVKWTDSCWCVPGIEYA